jgi:tetratricopeptide (TPR) repeat protein
MSVDPLAARAIFMTALDRSDPAERAAYLDEACGGDELLQQRVELLLKAHGHPGSFLQSPPVVQGGGADEPQQESPGTVIGPYQLLEEIGEGGMGTVWMAQQTEPVKRLVALKLIKAGMDSKQVIARFEAERQALALMDHANIARVLDGGTTNVARSLRERSPGSPGDAGLGSRSEPATLPDPGRPYFVMELIKGVPITRYCDEHHLTPRQRLELFIPVCQAVQHAHQKGIIHRDLKPSNVLVAHYDGVPVPKVIDFGVAKAAGQSLTDKTLVTGFGAIVGTLEYMSPEQAEINQFDIDTRSDIYSLGVLLYELLTGSPPFFRKEMEKGGVLEMLRVIREQEPTKPSTKLSQLSSHHAPRDEPGHVSRSETATLASIAINRGTEPAKLTKLVRGELDWIVMKALEKDRSRRYETAGAFAMDVQHYLADEPVQACPPSALYRFRKFARRNKAALAVAAVVALALTIIGAGIGYIVRDQGTRQAQLSSGIQSALLLAQERQDKGRWGEARAILDQALQRVGGAGPADLRNILEERLGLLDLVSRLDRIRLDKAILVKGKFDLSKADREYAEAFRSAGVGQVGDDPELVAQRIRGMPVLVPVTAALHEWSCSTQDNTKRTWLMEVARRADPDPWRDRLRDPDVWQRRATLEKLAMEARVSELSPALLTMLAAQLRTAGGDPRPLLIQSQAQYPADFWLCFDLANVLHNRKQPDEALGYFRIALALRPDASAVLVNLGLTLEEKGCLDDATDYYEKAIAVDPNNPSPHNNLSVVLRKKGRTDEAIRHAERALALNPRNARYYNSLGTCLGDKGQSDEAVRHYEKAIALAPDYFEAHFNLGIALKTKGRLDEARSHLDQALVLNPHSAPALNELGVVFHMKGRLAEAIRHYEKALALDPNLSLAHSNLGVALKDNRQPDRAIGHLKKAVALDPKNAGFHNNLGVALQANGQLDQAICSYEKAVALDPKYARGQGSLGQALLLVGRYEEARQSLHRAVGLLPAGDPVHKACSQNLKVAEHFLALEKKLPLVLNGRAKPASARERLDLAYLSQRKQFHTAAARFSSEAFAEQPALANTLQAHRYNAACSAALAAAGKGMDAPAEKDAEERMRLRRHALKWLQAELASWTEVVDWGTAPQPAQVQKALAHWQSDSDLAGVRDAVALARLPATERAAWEKFWADVAVVLKRIQEMK